MRSVLDEMLAKYELDTPKDKQSAYRQIVQEIILYGLQRGGFFKKAAIFGGTALRVFHGLGRFSEDLDFALMTPDESFQISDFFDELRSTLAMFDLNFAVEEKIKNKENNVKKTAIVRGGARETVMLFYPDDFEMTVGPHEVTRIKFEINVNPPAGASYELLPKRTPYLHEVRAFDMPSMFANKIDAVLARAWKNRIKGRDLYDYLFFLSKGTFVNMTLMKNDLVSSNCVDESFSLTNDSLKDLLKKRFSEIDYVSAKADVSNFISDTSVLDSWNGDYFMRMTEKLMN